MIKKPYYLLQIPIMVTYIKSLNKNPEVLNAKPAEGLSLLFLTSLGKGLSGAALLHRRILVISATARPKNQTKLAQPERPPQFKLEDRKRYKKKTTSLNHKALEPSEDPKSRNRLPLNP